MKIAKSSDGIPPTFAYVGRRDGLIPRIFKGQDINARPNVELAPQGAPDPIRQSDFWAVGKFHPWARYPVALHLNIPGILSVDKWSFVAGKNTPGWMILQRNWGQGQNPFGDRANIERADTETYGSRLTVPATGSQNSPTPGKRLVSGPGGLVYEM